jgi:hypothetical protein
MERTAIIREIMIRMDEILPPGESISHPFESHINSILDESYRQVLNEFPIAILPLKEITGLDTAKNIEAITEHSDGNILIEITTHGYITGDVVTITNDIYSGTQEITVVDNDTFTVDIAYISDDTTGNVALHTIIYESTRELAYVPVPTDFIRLGLFKFTDWTNPATKYISTDNPQYREVETGILAGGVIKPLVLLKHARKGHNTGPERYLICYKVSTDQSKEYLYYVYYNKDSGITELSDLAITGLSWCAAAKLMQIFELPGTKIAEERYQQFIISNLK